MTPQVVSGRRRRRTRAPRQPQATEECRRSRSWHRRAPAPAPSSSPSGPAPASPSAASGAGAARRLGGAGLPGLSGRGGGAARGRSLLTCGRLRLRSSGLSGVALDWAALGCTPGLRAPRQRPLSRSAPPGSAPPGGAPGARWRPTRRGVGAGWAGGRAPAAGAAPSRPAAAWKLLIWAVMSGEVAGAGPPTSFHSLARVSCRLARGTPAPSLPGRLSARLASASAAPRVAARQGHGGPRRGGSAAAGVGSASGESPAPGGRGQGLRGRLLGDRPCHCGRRPSLRARHGSRAVISSRALAEGSQGSPGRRRQGPAARRPASAAPGPCGRPWSSPKCSLPALLPGASSAPGSRRLPRREFALMSTGRGQPGPGASLGFSLGVGVGGNPGASQWPDFPRSCLIPALET